MIDNRRTAYRVRRWSTGVVLAGGAVVAAATGVAAAPAAHADELPPLPVPPFNLQNLPEGFFNPPGSLGVPTNVEKFSIPGLYTSLQQDNPYSVSDGSYETHLIEQIFGGGVSSVAYTSESEQVIASDGLAPAVGTEWDFSGLTAELIPGVFLPTQVFLDSSLTTSAGTADVFSVLGLENDFYDGPAGIFDYLGFNQNEASFIPIIDIPAETSPAAATDFSALWSDLLATP
jgi:hypothetical protein